MKCISILKSLPIHVFNRFQFNIIVTARIRMINETYVLIKTVFGNSLDIIAEERKFGEIETKSKNKIINYFYLQK